MIDSASTDILPLIGIDELKQYHKTILEYLIDKRYCMAVLPTGFGKSLPFGKSTTNTNNE
jgi:superfamily II DNA helicase RecQ